MSNTLLHTNESSPYTTTEVARTTETLPQTESAKNAERALEILADIPLSPNEPYPKETIIGGGNAIENQQLSFIKTAEGALLTFKLAHGFHHTDSLRAIPYSHDVGNVAGEFFDSPNTTNGRLVTQTVFNEHGLEGEIAWRTPFRALDRVATIRLPEQDENGALIHHDEMGRRIDLVMRELFGIENAFVAPEASSENEFKVARYAWSHNIGDEEPAHPPMNKLKRQEVFPGYSTIIEEGKHQEYEDDYSGIAQFHQLYSKKSLINVLKYGLMSTRERLTRGVMTQGMSSLEDLKSGGGDSVFVRTITEQSLKDGNDAMGYTKPFLVLKPECMDRTDWYCYHYDQYGSTWGDAFKDRISPDDLFERLNKYGWQNDMGNEEMYRTGIATKDIAGIAVSGQWNKKEIVDALHEADIHEVNGIPVEDFVQLTTRLSQCIDIAHGWPLRRPKTEQPHMGIR